MLKWCPPFFLRNGEELHFEKRKSFRKRVLVFLSCWMQVYIRVIMVTISEGDRLGKNLAQAFSYEFYEILKSTIFTEHLWWLLLNFHFHFQRGNGFSHSYYSFTGTYGKVSLINRGITVALRFTIMIYSTGITFRVHLNPLSTSFTKWSNSLKQIVGNLPTNCLNVFDNFCGVGA